MMFVFSLCLNDSSSITFDIPSSPSHPQGHAPPRVPQTPPGYRRQRSFGNVYQRNAFLLMSSAASGCLWLPWGNLGLRLGPCGEPLDPFEILGLPRGAVLLM